METKDSKPKLRIVKDVKDVNIPAKRTDNGDDSGDGYTDGERFIHREPVTETEFLNVIEDLLSAK